MDSQEHSLPTLVPILAEFLGTDVAIHPWEGSVNLPLFIQSLYAIYETTILDTECLILEVIGDPPRVEQIEKHRQLIIEQTSKEVVMFHHRISAQRLKTYISKRISFITGTEQVFLPFLGLKLTQQQREPLPCITLFSPITQCVYLMFLYEEDLVINTTQMAQRLNISEMSASRALNALAENALLTFAWSGPLNRSKTYRRLEGPQYVSKGLPFLQSPVLRTVFTNTKVYDGPIAGLEALSKMSMLNSPRYSVRAISSKQMSAHHFTITKDPGAFPAQDIIELQLWRYDPLLFCKDDVVDPISLYASLKEVKDERVIQALEEMVKGF